MRLCCKWSIAAHHQRRATPIWMESEIDSSKQKTIRLQILAVNSLDLLEKTGKRQPPGPGNTSPASGYAIVHFNGRCLTDAPLDPSWTAPDKRISFRTHDVTQALKQENNCIRLALGNRWFNHLPLPIWGRHKSWKSFFCERRPDARVHLLGSGDHQTGESTGSHRECVFHLVACDRNVASQGFDGPRILQVRGSLHAEVRPIRTRVAVSKGPGDAAHAGVFHD